MKLVSRVKLGSMLACLLTVGLLALPGAAQAANPGEVCNTNSLTIIDNSKGEILYIVEGGTPMRIEAYAGPELYFGHAQGKANGYFLRSQINQSSCHKT